MAECGGCISVIPTFGFVSSSSTNQLMDDGLVINIVKCIS